MQLKGTNQYGVTVYEVKPGLYYFTSHLDNSTFLEVTFKTSAPEKVTIQRLLKELGKSATK